MKVNLDIFMMDYAGKIVSDNGVPTPAGVFLARFVSQGYVGLEGDNILKCLTLSAKLHECGEVTLGVEDVALILDCINKNQNVLAWVKAYIRFLLDPDGVPEDLRKQIEKIYNKGGNSVHAEGKEGLSNA